MPARLRSILRAAESYPPRRCGLNLIVCWPRLWLVLPATTWCPPPRSWANP